MTQDYVNVTPKKERWFWPKLKTKKAHVFFWLTIFLSPLCYWGLKVILTPLSDDPSGTGLLIIGAVIALVLRCFCKRWGWYLAGFILSMFFFFCAQDQNMLSVDYASYDTGRILKAVPAKNGDAYLVYTKDDRNHKLYSQLIYKDTLFEDTKMTSLHTGQIMYMLVYSDKPHGVTYHFSWWPKRKAYYPSGNKYVFYYTGHLLEDNWNW